MIYVIDNRSRARYTGTQIYGFANVISIGPRSTLDPSRSILGWCCAAADGAKVYMMVWN